MQLVIAWQAFEPPIDMSQDVDICEDTIVENTTEQSHSGERSTFSHQSTSSSERTCCSNHGEAQAGSNIMHKSVVGLMSKQVLATLDNHCLILKESTVEKIQFIFLSFFCLFHLEI